MNIIVTRVSNLLAAAACICLLFLMLTTFADVVGRYFFNAPLTYAVEVIELGMGLLVFFGLAMTTLRGGHITVDLISGMVPHAVRRILLTFSSITAVIFMGLMTWRLLDRGSKFMSDGLMTQILSIPVYPIVYLMAFAAGISTLVALYCLIAPTQTQSEN